VNCGPNNPYCSTHFVFGTLGDSISRGFDIKTFGQEDTLDNWSSGLSLAGSQINLLGGLFSQQGWSVTAEVHNLAVTGQTVTGSNSQFLDDATQMASYNPDYVTLLIGSNDVCKGLVTDAVTQESFRAKVFQALSALANGTHPPKVIAVSSIPHIFNLSLIPALANSSTCPTAWNLLCPNMSIGQAAFDQQWTMANQAIADAAAAVGGPVIYDGGAVAATNFTADDVSTLDCFHPSATGQTKLANTVWQQVVGAVQTKIINQ